MTRLSAKIAGIAGIAVSAVFCGCAAHDPPESVAVPRALRAPANPFGPGDPQWAAQPERAKPEHVVLTADGATAWVSLAGTVDAPGRTVVAVDTNNGKLRHLVGVCPQPAGLALHPTAPLLVATCRLANHLAVIDTSHGAVLHTPAAGFYTERALFSADGQTLWLSNRHSDTVHAWQVQATADGLRIQRRHEPGVPVGANPRDLALSGDGGTLAVGSIMGMTVSLVDTKQRRERHRIEVGAPAADVLIHSGRVYVATLSAATHHLPHAGPDTDGDGKPGDGTPNVNFQDLQNELAVYRLSDGKPLFRYTSDTICCKDYRDVHPADLARKGDLLPPKSTWIVGGALPEQLALMVINGAPSLVVSYAGSNQLQRLPIDEATGALAAGPTWDSGGHNPRALATAAGKLVVLHRLSGTLVSHDAQAGKSMRTIALESPGSPEFPASDVELGELFNHVTSPFSVDGDQTCAHCHRDGGNINKAFSMPLTLAGGRGMRMTMAYRDAFNTRPWFFESAMDESNFKPVINEFARIENFCCHDYTLFPGGAPDDCSVNPPPECTATNAWSSDGFDAVRTGPGAMFASKRPTAHPSRDRFFRAAAEQLTGRRWTFGDALYFEDPVTDERLPVPLDFDGVTRALGLFLMSRPNLPPNPNPADTAATRRGKALFFSVEAGCATCHPGPSFTVADGAAKGLVPVRMPPVVTPLRDAQGRNLDLLAPGFLQAFPAAEQDRCEDVCDAKLCAKSPNACDHLRRLFLGAPGLRGLWDRASSMLHHGRAKSLREVLATPGHPALRPGEIGRNELDGVIDSHGGTSHLSKQELIDLETFLLSL